MASINIPPSVARLCEAELNARVPRLRAAVGVSVPDCRQVREDAHALRGMLANVGMADAASVLAALEDAAADGSALRPLLAALEPHLEPTMRALAACR
jgi:HPt (histidine-containing phosphotransfer) domain-containing protein